MNPAALTVTTGSAEKAFDGTALTSSEASVSGLVSGESVTVTATGTQTDAGSSENTYTIDWGSVSAENYALSESLGTLTVSKVDLSVNCGGGTFTYDQDVNIIPGSAVCGGVSCSPLMSETDDGYITIYNLPTGDTATLTTKAVFTHYDVGTYSLDANLTVSGNSDNYNLQKNSTSVTIQPLSITVNAPNRTSLSPRRLKTSATMITVT